MKRTPIESSAIVSAGYDLESKTLEIEFVGGRLYQYYDVPLATFQALLESESAGGYFNASIRDRYRYVRVAGN